MTTYVVYLTKDCQSSAEVVVQDTIGHIAMEALRQKATEMSVPLEDMLNVCDETVTIYVGGYRTGEICRNELAELVEGEKAMLGRQFFEPKERNYPPHVQANVDARSKIHDKCDQVKNLLLRKNADYGNSALDPVRIFSKADAEEQIRVRIDDKLSRLAGAGEKNFSEDTVMDLVGYLILLMVKMEGGE